MTIREPADLSDERPAEHETLRAILSGGYHPDLPARLTAELGLAGWTIPGEFGGLGKSLVEACAVHAELGRALYPGPFLSSSVAAGALLAAGHRAACERWLPLLAAGTAAGAVAAADEAGHWAPGAGSVRADYGTGGWRLSGRRWYVVSAEAADVLLVPAVTDAGLAMFLAETGSPSVALARQLDLDLTRQVSIVTFDSAPAELLTKDGAPALGRAEREFLIAVAAEAAGGIGWCVDITLACVREQGRQPATVFEQAAQLCVDMVADMDTVTAAARYAAAATDIGAADAQQAAHQAALQAGESYRRAIGASLSFADEADGLLHYRRAWSAERLAGGPQAHRAALAAQLADSRPVAADPP